MYAWTTLLRNVMTYFVYSFKNYVLYRNIFRLRSECGKNLLEIISICTYHTFYMIKKL